MIVWSALSPLHAQGSGGAGVSGIVGFKAPSGNIHYQSFDGASDKGQWL